MHLHPRGHSNLCPAYYLLFVCMSLHPCLHLTKRSLLHSSRGQDTYSHQTNIHEGQTIHGDYGPRCFVTIDAAHYTIDAAHYTIDAAHYTIDAAHYTIRCHTFDLPAPCLLLGCNTSSCFWLLDPVAHDVIRHDVTRHDVIRYTATT